MNRMLLTKIVKGLEDRCIKFALRGESIENDKIYKIIFILEAEDSDFDYFLIIKGPFVKIRYNHLGLCLIVKIDQVNNVISKKEMKFIQRVSNPTLIDIFGLDKETKFNDEIYEEVEQRWRDFDQKVRS